MSDVQDPVHPVRGRSYRRPMLVLDPRDARPASAHDTDLDTNRALAEGFLAAVRRLDLLDDERLAALARSIVPRT